VGRRRPHGAPVGIDAEIGGRLRLGARERQAVSGEDHSAGSITEDIDPLQRGIHGSGPNAWIWSRFSSARSRLVVSTITRPVLSTSWANWNPFSGGWPNSCCSMMITYS